jgi:hypothetical protein
MFVFVFLCCVVFCVRRDLCDLLITSQKQSYQVSYVNEITKPPV